MTAPLNTAIAGEIQVDAPPIFKPKTVSATVALSTNPNDLDLSSPGADGIGKWTFSFKNPAAYLAPITVSITSVPDGYEPFKLTFDIPYYWERGGTRKLAAALSDDSHYDEGARLFLQSANAVPSDLAALALMNQRARRIWGERYNDLLLGQIAPSENDVKLAYWLLSTSQQLVLKQGLELDQVTKWGMDWISNLLSDQSKAALFSTKTVPAENARQLVSQLQNRDPYIYNLVVQQMTKDLASPDRVAVKAVCNRIQGLNTFYLQFDEDALKQYNGQFGNSLVTAANVATCKTLELAEARANGTALDAESVAAASAALTSVRSAIAEAQTKGIWRPARSFAAARATDLGTYIEP